MKELHIIVHEDAVIEKMRLGIQSAVFVYNEIQHIKQSKDYISLPTYHQAHILSSSMPPPSDDLRVIVSGAFEHACCTLQLFMLRENGYNARFHTTAVCPGYGYLPSLLYQEIEEKYPDFYEPFEN